MRKNGTVDFGPQSSQGHPRETTVIMNSHQHRDAQQIHIEFHFNSFPNTLD